MEFLGIMLLPIGGGKEKSMFEILKRHSKTVVVTVRKSKEAIVTYSEQNYDKGKELFLELDKLESKADKLGEQFEEGLSSGVFLPAFRGHLSNLKESVDDVADAAVDTVRDLYLRPKVFDDLLEAEKENDEVKIIREGLTSLASKSIDCAVALDAAISVLLEDMDKAMEKAEEIHQCEGESDDVEEELLADLYKYEDLLPPVTVVQVKELIEMIGGVSDMAEDAGDILSAMCVALKA